MSLLGLDVGTTGCKAVAFTPDGAVLARAYAEYPLLSPRPGWQELDPVAVWDGVAGTLRAVAAATGDLDDPIEALAVSSQGEAMVPVDGALRPLYNSLVTFDSRADAEAAALVERLGRERVYEVTGMPPSAMHTIGKLAWLRRAEPDVFGRAAHFLCWQDYVGARLGAPPAIDYSLAGRTMALDVRGRRWWPDILDAAGVRVGSLAEPVPAGTAIGAVSAEMTAELGLPAGARIVAGGHDQPCGALGSGALAAGEAMDATGTVECIAPTLAGAAINQDMLAANLCCYPHVIPDRYITLTFTFGAGSVLRWYRDTLAGEERAVAAARGVDPYEVILAAMPEDPTDLLVLPHLAGAGTPSLDLHSRGAVLGLTLSTSRGELIKGLLEGITLEMALNLDLLRRAGASVERLHAIGGGTRSARWLQLKADVFGLPVAVLHNPEGAAWGAALLAGWGAGILGDLAGALRATARITGRYEPDTARHAVYRSRLEVYRDLYPAVAPLTRRVVGGEGGKES